jgi:hypothetical protein
MYHTLSLLEAVMYHSFVLIIDISYCQLGLLPFKFTSTPPGPTTNCRTSPVYPHPKMQFTLFTAALVACCTSYSQYDDSRVSY